MNICDFSKSFLRFSSDRIQNRARLQLDALCFITETQSKRTVRFALTAPCIGENMYQEKELIQSPSCEFRMIASEQHYRMIKNYPAIEMDSDPTRAVGEIYQSFDGKKGRVTEIFIHTPEISRADEIRDYPAFEEAFLGNRALVGVTEFQSADGGFQARMEYPIKTSNIHPPSKGWQMDAGPVLYADFAAPSEQWINFLHRAYIVYNTLDWADVVIHRPTPIAKDGREAAQVAAYHQPFRISAENRIFAMG